MFTKRILEIPPNLPVDKYQKLGRFALDVIIMILFRKSFVCFFFFFFFIGGALWNDCIRANSMITINHDDDNDDYNPIFTLTSYMMILGCVYT